MTFIESIRTCFSKYATFKGTASCSEYWWFYLFCTVAGMVLAMESYAAWLVFVLVTLVPLVAAGVRRLHDTDRSGWLMLIGLIPVIGQLILLVFLVQGSRPNRFGVDPAAQSAALLQTPSLAKSPAPEQADS